MAKLIVNAMGANQKTTELIISTQLLLKDRFIKKILLINL